MTNKSTTSIKQKEILGWMLITEKSLKKIWDNLKDNEIWQKYL